MLARVGQILDISKTKAGQTLDKTQFYGQSVDKVWTLRKIGQTMDKLWTKFGQSLDNCPGFVQTPIVHQHRNTRLNVRLMGNELQVCMSHRSIPHPQATQSA